MVEKRHNGYTGDRVHVTSLDAEAQIIGDDLDPNYVFSVRVRTGRSIRGFALPPHSDRCAHEMIDDGEMSILNMKEKRTKNESGLF